jgi:soluble lytic murein transglycosylase
MQFSAILTLIVFTGSVALSLAAPAQTRGDEIIVEMQQAFKKGDRKRLAALLPQAAGHALEPWAAYWELKNRLDTATASEVHDYFARFPGTYQEDRLRNDWLLLLGQKRDWTNFAAEHLNYRMLDDRELRCYSLAVENSFAGLDVAAQVKLNWYAQRDADDGCNYIAARLYGAKKLSDADIWRKVRLSLEGNRPKAARMALDIVAPDAAGPFAEILDNAARFLSKRVVAVRSVNRELVLLALIRMAANDPDAAAYVLENHWSVHLQPEQLAWAWGAIGKSAAQRVSNDAMAHFSKAKDTFLTDDTLAWKVRAALRKGLWKEVLTATSAMTDEARLDNTWVYWRARAQLKLAKSEAERAEGLAALQTIAGPRGFYEQLALEDLGQKVTVPPRPLPPEPEEKAVAQSNPGLKRALQAISLGLRSEGVREWNYSTNLHTRGGMSDRELLAAADLACQREVWDRCINTSERTKTFIDMEQRFPMPFKEAVVARAKQIDLDPAYVYGLIRQESRFIMDARSGVGASGLMQVMPATARWTAKKIGLTDFQPQQITERDTNIAIGTGYLKLVLDDFAGSMPMAAAAYNAGPSRPRSWRGSAGGPVLEAAIWAENVPFAETRDYVKKVLSNTTVYAALITGQPQSLKARLGSIGPRDAAAAAPNTDLP